MYNLSILLLSDLTLAGSAATGPPYLSSGCSETRTQVNGLQFAHSEEDGYAVATITDDRLMENRRIKYNI